MSICILNKISALEAKSQNRVESALITLRHGFFQGRVNGSSLECWRHCSLPHPAMIYGQKVLDQILRRQANIPALAGSIERVTQIGAVDMVNDRLEELENIRGVLLEVLYEVVWTHAVSSSTSG